MNPYASNVILHGDAGTILKTIPEHTVQMCVTSPPYYGLRDYGVEGQLGLEETPEHYIERLVEVFREVKRVLRPDGTLWVNMGDSYACSMKGMGADGKAYGGPKQRTNHGSIGVTATDWAKTGLKNKDLIGVPWMLAFALRADGWWLRQDIIWHKPSAMPESVTDRCTKAHEYIFLLSKSASYFFDADAIKEVACTGQDLGLLRGRSFADGNHVSWHADSIRKRQELGIDSYTAGSGYRNKRSVWSINPQPYSEAHFATFPPKLIEPCILAGSRPGDIVLDCFMGAGTTALVALQHGRRYLGIELNEAYIALAEKRIAHVQQNLWTSVGEAVA